MWVLVIFAVKDYIKTNLTMRSDNDTPLVYAGENSAY